VSVWALLSVTGVVHVHRPALAFLPLAAVPMIMAPVRLALGQAEGRALLPVLAATGRLQLVFGLLLSVSLWLCLPLALPWGLP
jgi:1,4-dihydroxy-2-naphthoate octaprenyltransferase